MTPSPRRLASKKAGASDVGGREAAVQSLTWPVGDGGALLDADVEAAPQRVDRRLARAGAAMDQVGQDIDGHQLQARFS